MHHTPTPLGRMTAADDDKSAQLGIRLKFRRRLVSGARGRALTLLGSEVNSATVLMHLNDDGKQLCVMENPEAVDPKFYSLNR